MYHLLEDYFSRKTFFFILRTKLLPYDFHSLNDVRCGGYQYFRSELIGAKGQGVLKFDSRRGGGCRFSEDGNIDVPVDTLDEIIKEPITFLKMDIEGAELNSLKGGKKHIVEDKPYLAICLYHRLEDSIDIPLYLLELNPEQNFNVRYHSCHHNTYEVVLYATPQTGNQKTAPNLNRLRPSLKEDSFMAEKENSIVIQKILEEVSKSPHTCFFGAGQVCHKALNYYQEHKLPKPVVICDNNKDLHGTKIQGIPVMSLQDILSKWDDCHIVLTVGTAYKKEVYQQILKQVPQERIYQHIQFYSN